jgi:hypothetical protein
MADTNERDPSLAWLGLPLELEAELAALFASFPPARSLEEVIASEPSDAPNPWKDFAYKLLESPETAVAGLRLVLKGVGTGFAASASVKVKLQGCAVLMLFLQEFVRRHVTQDTDSLAILAGLHADIENLAEGRATSFLIAQRTTGRPRQAKQDEALWAIASATIDMFLEGEIGEQEASQTLVAFLEQRDFPLPPATRSSGALPADRLLNWRARLRRTREITHARQIYDMAKAIVRNNNVPEATDVLMKLMEMSGTKVQ